MEISSQIVRPLIERLYEEYQELDRELAPHSSDEVAELKTFVHKKMRQLQTLDSTVSGLTPALLSESLSYNELRHQLRQLKLQLRFAQRRWKRQIVNESRFRRRLQGKLLMPTAAA